MERTGRNDLLLQRMAARTGILSSSIDSIKACLDPFHDTPIDPDGWPDMVTSSSIVQCIKQELSITAPPSTVTNGGTWRVHIFNSPYFNTTFGGNGSQSLTYQQNSSGYNNSVASPTNFNATYVVAGINVVASDSSTGFPTLGQVTFLPAQSSATTQYAEKLTINLAQTVGVCRIFGSGIEVHNTTAELYKGGSVLAYRQPLDDESYQSTITLLRSTTLPSSIAVIPIAAPPVTPAVALNLKNSLQWEAKDGAYQVHALHSPNLPNNGTTFLMPSYYSVSPQDANQVTTGVNSQTLTASYPSGSTPSNVIVDGANQQMWTQFDCSGLWFEGLTAQTTLLLNWNCFIERFPSQLETDLVLVARTSPEYDTQALEFISAASKALPVATMVKNNGLGEWFADVLQAGADYVAPIFNASKHPVLQGIGGALTGGAKMMSTWNKRPKAEKKAINNAAKADIRRMAGGGGKGAKVVKAEAKKEVKKEAKKEVRKELKGSNLLRRQTQINKRAQAKAARNFAKHGWGH